MTIANQPAQGITSLTIRQSVDSANNGYIDVLVFGFDLNPNLV